MPGTGHVGEIILRDLVAHAGPSRFHCVGVVGPKYQWRPDPALETSVSILRTRHATAKRWSRAAWGAAGSVFNHLTGLKQERAALVSAIVAEGRKYGIGQVFAVLNNAMMFGLAHRVAAKLGVPLVTLVWDPPEYQLTLGRFDRWTRKALMAEFAKSLANSKRVAVVSENMQRDYSRYTQAPIQILRHGLSNPVASEAEPGARDEWVIGFAGSMYSKCAWNAFIASLDSVDWRLAGKPVRLRVLSAKMAVASRARARVEYLGFRSSGEVQAVLAGCDACYLPQPFLAHLKELSRYSFPTKLTNYMALGIPVIAHAPDYGALAPFLREHRVGVHVPSLEAGEIARILGDFLADAEGRREMALTARTSAEQMFSDRSFHAAVDELLGNREWTAGRIAS